MTLLDQILPHQDLVAESYWKEYRSVQAAKNYEGEELYLKEPVEKRQWTR